MKPTRNEHCPCLSGKKYKKCCLVVEKADEIKNQLPFGHFVLEYDPEIEATCEIMLNKIEQGDLAVAKKAAKNLYDKYPNYHMVLFLNGICALKENNLEVAAIFFKQATKVFPYFTEAYFNLGCVYLQYLEIAAAVDAFKDVILIDGAQGDYGKMASGQLDNLTQLTLKYQNSTLEDFLQLNELFQQGIVYLQAKKYLEALERFQIVLDKDDQYVQCHNNMGAAYLGLGQNDLAKVCFEKALVIDKDYQPAIDSLALISKLQPGDESLFSFNVIRFYRDIFK